AAADLGAGEGVGDGEVVEAGPAVGVDVGLGEFAPGGVDVGGLFVAAVGTVADGADQGAEDVLIVEEQPSGVVVGLLTDLFGCDHAVAVAFVAVVAIDGIGVGAP